jgi:hypothetical protein
MKAGPRAALKPPNTLNPSLLLAMYMELRGTRSTVIYGRAEHDCTYILDPPQWRFTSSAHFLFDALRNDGQGIASMP